MLTSGPDRRFIAIRCVGLMLVSAAVLQAAAIPLPTALSLSSAIIWSAIAAWLQASLAKTATQRLVAAGIDAVANIALVIAGGGFGSPIFLLLPAVAMSVAQRGGYGPGFLAGGLAAAAGLALNGSAAYWQ